MPHFARPARSQHPSNLLLLAYSLIAATALAALLVMTMDARAQTAKSLVCAPDDRGVPAPIQSRRGEQKLLVPPGATELIVCRYNGMNAFGGAPQWALRGAGATVNRTRVRQIVGGLDALEQTHGVYNCPFSDSSDDVVTFRYSSPPSVVVTMDTGDCNTLTNGHLRRMGLGKPVVAQIESVAKPLTGQTWASVRGHLRLCGGLVPGRCYIENYDSSDRVVATGSNGLWVAMANVHRGRFTFQIAASGTYTFGFYAGNTLVKKLRRQVTVGETTSIVFPISIR